jgi:hypothetical protein
MKHILIIGGTGMLRQASEYFIEQGHIVTLLARNGKRLNAIKQKYPKKKGKILTIAQDYRKTEAAMECVKNAADMYMHIDLAILWIHNSGREFSEEVKEFLFSHHPSTKVWQVWGSTTIKPRELSKTIWKKRHPKRYREIFLGYKRNRSSTRWLTDREISDGTIRAVEKDEMEFTIGTTDNRMT